jgi:hypothetical protein
LELAGSGSPSRGPLFFGRVRHLPCLRGPVRALQALPPAGHNPQIASKKGESPAQLIDARIEELDDWRGEMLSRVRSLIKQADPEVVEEFKWKKASTPGVPVWSHGGMICTGETYKAVVKLTFAKGASLEDPSGLFNSSLEGNVRRAIDIREGEAIDEDAFRELIREAVSLNQSSGRAPKKRRDGP